MKPENMSLSDLASETLIFHFFPYLNLTEVQSLYVLNRAMKKKVLDSFSQLNLKQLNESFSHLAPEFLLKTKNRFTVAKRDRPLKVSFKHVFKLDAKGKIIIGGNESYLHKMLANLINNNRQQLQISKQSRVYHNKFTQEFLKLKRSGDDRLSAWFTFYVDTHYPKDVEDFYFFPDSLMVRDRYKLNKAIIEEMCKTALNLFFYNANMSHEDKLGFFVKLMNLSKEDLNKKENRIDIGRHLKIPGFFFKEFHSVEQKIIISSYIKWLDWSYRQERFNCAGELYIENMSKRRLRASSHLNNPFYLAMGAAFLFSGFFSLGLILTNSVALLNGLFAGLIIAFVLVSGALMIKHFCNNVRQYKNMAEKADAMNMHSFFKEQRIEIEEDNIEDARNCNYKSRR